MSPDEIGAAFPEGLATPLMSDRHIVVTGATGGLGEAVVATLAKAGARVAALDADDRVLRTRREGADAYVVDVTDRDALLAVRDAVEAVWEAPADGLVNFAGVFRSGASAALPSAEWERHLNVNLTGTFNACAVFGERMVAAGSGSIVNVGSILGVRGKSRHAAYAASKHGVHGVTRALADEWGPAGVRVNAIAPGRIETTMTVDAFADAAGMQAYLGRVPLRRVGSPTDVIGPVLFLLSSLSAYVTGHAIMVDGGLTSTA